MKWNFIIVNKLRLFTIYNINDMYIYIYMYREREREMCICMYVCIYIYIYRERERERDLSIHNFIIFEILRGDGS